MSCTCIYQYLFTISYCVSQIFHDIIEARTKEMSLSLGINTDEEERGESGQWNVLLTMFVLGHAVIACIVCSYYLLYHKYHTNDNHTLAICGIVIPCISCQPNNLCLLSALQYPKLHYVILLSCLSSSILLIGYIFKYILYLNIY